MDVWSMEALRHGWVGGSTEGWKCRVSLRSSQRFYAFEASVPGSVKLCLGARVCVVFSHGFHAIWPPVIDDTDSRVYRALDGDRAFEVAIQDDQLIVDWEGWGMN